MRIVKYLVTFTCFGALALALSCGSGGSSSPPLVPLVTVSISHTSVTLPSQGTQVFTATVSNTIDTRVTWSIDPSQNSGKLAVSSDTLQCTYTAPTVNPVSVTFKVIATSVADPTKSATANVTVNPPVIYAGGFYMVNDTGVWVPGYWMGTESQGLAWQGLKPLVNGKMSMVHSIVVLGSNVYAGGYSSNSETSVPGYWDNKGDFVSLPFQGSGEVRSMVVSGSDVYAGGNTCIDAAGVAVPGYWKNQGPFVALSNTAGRVNALAVSGNEVYAGGYHYSNGTRHVGYWKKTATTTDFVELNTLDPSSSDVWSLALWGTDVYTGGYSKNWPCYWKNQNWMGLPNDNPTLEGSVFSIAVSDGIVRAGGWRYENDLSYPGYWYNRTSWVGLPLPSGADEGYVLSLVVSGNDVYAGGYCHQTTGSARYVPVYWKNGTCHAITLPIPTENTYVSSLFVQ